MRATMGSAARRELAVVLGVAFSGVALTLLVAFAPWYGRAAVAVPESAVKTYPSVVASPVFASTADAAVATVAR